MHAALDDACQPRAVTDLNLAGEYAEAMLYGAQFPPVVVFGDGDAGYWLADGYHRWHAAWTTRPSPACGPGRHLARNAR
jgi:hypothetical protein